MGILQQNAKKIKFFQKHLIFYQKVDKIVFSTQRLRVLTNRKKF